MLGQSYLWSQISLPPLPSSQNHQTLPCLLENWVNRNCSLRSWFLIECKHVELGWYHIECKNVELGSSVIQRLKVVHTTFVDKGYSMSVSVMIALLNGMHWDIFILFCILYREAFLLLWYLKRSVLIRHGIMSIYSFSIIYCRK